MSAVDPSTVPNVLDASVAEGLGESVVSAATLLESTMASAIDRWGRLRELFDLAGAEGAFSLLDPARGAAAEYVTVMLEARSVLSDAAMYTLPTLKGRRERLLERVDTVNQQHADAISALSEAKSAYWSSYFADPDSPSTLNAYWERAFAENDEDSANSAVSELQQDIERLRSDIETEEGYIAGALGRISGGDVVRGAWGAEIRISQTYWGKAEYSYPGGPSSTSGLAPHVRQLLSDAAADRIAWLGSARTASAEDWLAEHPDFASAVGFVDTQRAARLFETLLAQSTAGADGGWEAGPLAALFGLAPFAIGNLNGIPATVKDTFNRETLKDLLAGELSDEHREQLESLNDLLDDDDEDEEGNAGVTLLSLFLETDDASPRASVGFGDVDSANQITTYTHGIETDMASLSEWSMSANELKRNLDRELVESGISATTATVVFFEWDSGGTGNVWNIERPDGGAERMAQLLRGFEAVNPDAQLNLGLHSLGTSAGAQMIVDNPKLVDNVWFYGSAGITETTAKGLETLINKNWVNVYATHASDDFIAPLGRLPASEHPVNPIEIKGVEEFGSDGGMVAGYGYGPGSEYGERTEGHNSQASTEWYYLFDGFDSLASPQGSVLVPVVDDEAVGYLDPASQSFKQSVMGLVAAIESMEGSR